MVVVQLKKDLGKAVRAVGTPIKIVGNLTWTITEGVASLVFL